MPKKIKQVKKESIGDAIDILNFGNRHHIIFTDGGCYPNNKSVTSKGGYSSVFVSGPLNNKCIYGNLPVDTIYASNIRAEGMAIIRTFEIIYENDKKNTSEYKPQNWDKITLVSDCEFWINMLTLYMPRWDKQKFKEKANPDLTGRLWLIYKELSLTGDITLVHMKSHNKSGWKSFKPGTFEKFCYDQNDYADVLCTYARNSVNVGDESFEDIAYEDIVNSV
jgi:ribonuclease HI